MASLDPFLERRLSRGHVWFTRENALRALSASDSTLTTSLSKLARNHRIANPRPGFYLILRPEDHDSGAPDPAQWIHALMLHQQCDYRISLLSAAHIHGATVEAPAFQLVVPRELRDFGIGRHRLEFTAQAENSFSRTNRLDRLKEWKTGSAVAKAAGIELTLLDCARWFHKAGGISRVAQIARELGTKAGARKLATLAQAYESVAVRRLGYLLELAGHERQASALDPFASRVGLRPTVLLDPTSKIEVGEMSGRWKIAVNTKP
ncbi:MAG: type IV toxin-antitoxin system AbiEi family antitoxin domain-containing protein [Gemmatimonadaceae bacterium]